MISKQIIEDINNSSAIRAMFTEGQQLAQEIGAENVYDFSLGNPCTPVPEAYTRALLEVLDQEESPVLHGYMANTGYPEPSLWHCVWGTECDYDSGGCRGHQYNYEDLV